MQERPQKWQPVMPSIAHNPGQPGNVNRPENSHKVHVRRITRYRKEIFDRSEQTDWLYQKARHLQTDIKRDSVHTGRRIKNFFVKVHVPITLTSSRRSAEK